LRAARRRQRKIDPLASPSSVRSVLALLKSLSPSDIPDSESEMRQILRAARHVRRYPASDTKRGRPSKYDRERLIRVASRLDDLLNRETSGRISFTGFVDFYLPVLDFPSDVVDALERGDVNLNEASQLARITGERLGGRGGEARRLRAELVGAHVSAGLSSTRLRVRVNELLCGGVDEGVGGVEQDDVGSGEAQGFGELGSFDVTHLFWDQLIQISVALRSLTPDDVEAEELDELLRLCDPVLNFIARVGRRKQARAARLSKLRI
jgi:hypothetical protein